MRHKNGALYRAFVRCWKHPTSKGTVITQGGPAGARSRCCWLLCSASASCPWAPWRPGRPYNLADEFTLTNGATLVDGEYYAYAGDINFNWEISGGVDLNKEPKGSALLICFAKGTNNNAAIEGIAIKNGMTRRGT